MTGPFLWGVLVCHIALLRIARFYLCHVYPSAHSVRRRVVTQHVKRWAERTTFCGSTTVSDVQAIAAHDFDVGL